MQRPSFIFLIAFAVLGVSCSRGLRNRADAGRDGAIDCLGSPPEACGYVCQDGVWVATGELCVAPDSAVPDPGERDAKAKDGQVTDTGGATATGGLTGSGGVTATAGVSATGGTTASGGVGGTASIGGTTAGGSTTATADATATGGVTGQGGATAVGGVTGTGGSRGVFDAGAAAGCVDLSGGWRLSGSCYGPHASFNGNFQAVMTQTGCNLTFVRTDERDPWTSNGILESTGHGYLKGKFGFTDSTMCDLSVTDVGWDMVCASATQQCNLQAQKLPGA